jgi:demethylmenaquinone methyltransferase/2-methoxy-6-polyprenyl-1,4-benzoquinol methylase
LAYNLGIMANLSGDERSHYVKDVFTHIAPRYDLMNRLMTGGQDRRWRREVIRRARLSAGERLLDLGAGTGDLSREALKQQPQAIVLAADFTLQMMRVGKNAAPTLLPLSWSAADALHLPFGDHTFAAVVSGFLMRNVVNLPLALAEQFRVLKPSGRIVILDTTRPRRSLISPFTWIHMHLVIPTLGTLISGHRDAYTYLPDSTESFLYAEELGDRLTEAGFVNIGFRRLMLGTIAIHWAEKSKE